MPAGITDPTAGPPSRHCWVQAMLMDIRKWCSTIVVMSELSHTWFKIFHDLRGRIGHIRSETNGWNSYFKALQLSNRAAEHFHQWPGSSWSWRTRECAGLLYTVIPQVCISHRVPTGVRFNTNWLSAALILSHALFLQSIPVILQDILRRPSALTSLHCSNQGPAEFKGR